MEKRLEIGASSGAALTAAFGNERRGRSQNLQSACATGLRPGLPGTDLSSARRFHQVTSTALRRSRGTSRAKRIVFGRKRGAERTTSASLLADDVPGTQLTTTSVVEGIARDDVGGRFGGSEHHRQEARTFAPPSHFGVMVRCSHRPRSERVLGRRPLRRVSSPSSGLGRGSVLVSLLSLRRGQGRRTGLGWSDGAEPPALRCHGARRFRPRVGAKA